MYSDNSLYQSYEEVFNKAKNLGGFDEISLMKSRELFHCEKVTNTYSPKAFSVYALLGGIQFSEMLKKHVIEIQTKIELATGITHKYWVKPENLGVEYLVTKWPDGQALTKEMNENFISHLKSFSLDAYHLKISGYQVNPDGCIVLRGYDGGKIRSVRDALRAKLPWIPTRQSGWAHIPIGRILEKLDKHKHRELIALCENSHSEFQHNELINQIHYVHEKKWYMEDKSYIYTHKLNK